MNNDKSRNQNDGKLFVSFITAGDPCIEKTKEFLEVLAKYSDIIEIGLPFSDPIAEGEIIERANMRALSAGTTTDKVFDLVKSFRFPRIVILTYLNPVFVYGADKFFKNCKESGVWGVIIPDLPYEEKGEVAEYAKKYGIQHITLVAPTSKDRIQMLAKDAAGFVYLVSSMGVTGTRENLDGSPLQAMVQKIKTATDTPVCVGFGISTNAQVQNVWQVADGAIVGSAFVKLIEQYGVDAAPHLEGLIKELTGR